MNGLHDKLREVLLAAYVSPVMLGGVALCVRFQPPIWVGVPAVLSACGAWSVVVYRYFPPFRGEPPPWRDMGGPG